MKRPHKVEFYLTGVNGVYGWRMRAPNNQPIFTPHDLFISHRNAIESFKRVANAMQCAEGTVFEVDGFDMDKSVRLLCR